MTLPEVSARLRTLAEELECSELDDLANEIKRRSSKQRAPNTSLHLTPQLIEKVKELKAQNPAMSQLAIATYFNINHGRVSEILNGYRT